MMTRLRVQSILTPSLEIKIDRVRPRLAIVRTVDVSARAILQTRRTRAINQELERLFG